MLNEDYRDMLSAFAVEGVSYLLVGAFAMAAHARDAPLGRRFGEFVRAYRQGTLEDTTATNELVISLRLVDPYGSA